MCQSKRVCYAGDRLQGSHCPRGNLPYIRNYPIYNAIFNLIYPVGSWIYLPYNRLPHKRFLVYKKFQMRHEEIVTLRDVVSTVTVKGQACENAEEIDVNICHVKAMLSPTKSGSGKYTQYGL